MLNPWQIRDETGTRGKKSSWTFAPVSGWSSYDPVWHLIADLTCCCRAGRVYSAHLLRQHRRGAGQRRLLFCTVRSQETTAPGWPTQYKLTDDDWQFQQRACAARATWNSTSTTANSQHRTCKHKGVYSSLERPARNAGCAPASKASCRAPLLTMKPDVR